MRTLRAFRPANKPQENREAMVRDRLIGAVPILRAQRNLPWRLLEELSGRLQPFQLIQPHDANSALTGCEHSQPARVHLIFDISLGEISNLAVRSALKADSEGTYSRN